MIAAERELVPVTRALRHVVRALFELYCYDFSPMTNADVNEDGRYTDAHFLNAWQQNGDQDTWLFLLRVSGRWAGFTWVGRGSFIAPGAHVHWLMEEFFILRSLPPARTRHLARPSRLQPLPWHLGSGRA